MERDRDLIAAISKLGRALRRHPNRKDALSHVGFHTLQTVYENDGIRATELAKRMEVRPASITDTLDRLERDGYVIRKKAETDGRVNLVYATDKARERFQGAERNDREKNDLLLSCLTEEEADQFLDICDRLCAVLESTPYSQE